MSYRSLSTLKVLLVTLLTSIAITGIGFLDNIIWNNIIAAVSVTAYGVVSIFISLRLVNGNERGKTFLYVFIVLLIVGFVIYQGIISFENWVFSWPLAVKITVPVILGIGSIMIIIALLVSYCRNVHEE